MKRIGLYIHIPFCLQKCAYCDFYSIPGRDEALQKRYINALTLHMKTLSTTMEDRVFDTVYIGGGTPGLLTAEMLTTLINGINDNFKLTEDAEITLETNPAVADEAKFRVMRSLGINRLSMGMQSSEESVLRTLGRLHTFDQFAETFREARRAGFENLSADVMYALPGQTVDGLLETIRSLIALSPEHISMYGLKVEENTPFGRLGGKLSLPDEDIQCEMYERACDLLETEGYHRYEISNFVKDGYESRHNLRYWQREEYLGLGPAAHSFVDGVRYSYPRDIMAYITALEQGSLTATDSLIRITPAEAEAEKIMLGLRLAEGIIATAELLKKCENYLRYGFMKRKGERIAFTTKGFLVSNTILAELLDD
ncbi:MAG: radical SAM family heme chaperone HemW [Clostridia bacterium]|nr:radical SAM family heme chaperone HemW [Clostridia bacterium]